MKLDRLRIAWLVCFLAPLALSGCGNGIDSIDLDATPPAVHDLSVETSSTELLLRWDLLEEVSPELSFSGYKVYLKREDEDAFEVWTQFHLRSGSTTHLPLLHEGNSLSGGRMEVWAVGLTNGILHSFYVTGVQNGNEGPPSAVVSDVPFKLITNIEIIEESRSTRSWYDLGAPSADLGSLTMDRVGYAFEESNERHYLRFLPIAGGGWLRVQNAGPSAAKTDAPTDAAGAPVGFHVDPALGLLEIAEGDYVFVWDTGGTAGAGDDHFSRLRIANIVEVPSDRNVKIDCAYQSRPNTPNL